MASTFAIVLLIASTTVLTLAIEAGVELIPNVQNQTMKFMTLVIIWVFTLIGSIFLLKNRGVF